MFVCYQVYVVLQFHEVGLMKGFKDTTLPDYFLGQKCACTVLNACALCVECVCTVLNACALR